jgi:hypothetical protein
MAQIFAPNAAKGDGHGKPPLKRLNPFRSAGFGIKSAFGSNKIMWKRDRKGMV